MPYSALIDGLQLHDLAAHQDWHLFVAFGLSLHC